jgi:predicted ATPase/DNA-binding CsgD family transcriptional regulator
MGMGPLVGRERERGLVSGLLGEARLVTLTGVGGSGKTRLAIQVAGEVAGRFDDNVGWTELAGLTDPARVAAAVAGTVGVAERAGRNLTDDLVERLQGRALLLVMDNCEHVAEACATLLGRLLAACPGLSVLATSRAPLAVGGETTIGVPPLAVPDAAARTPPEVGSAPAVRLFVARARQADPGFALTEQTAPVVAEICRRLDGLPLALELAAARTRVLGVADIAAGLGDRFGLLGDGPRDADPRQRSLHASVAWSERLLDAPGRLALARLAVFASSFTLDAARAVVADERLGRDQVPVAVGALVDNSLLGKIDQPDGRARYRMLETIRAYARERLAEIENPQRVRDRHLAFHIDLSRRAEAGLASPTPEPWLDRLTADLDDLRAAMDHALAAGRPLAVVDMVAPSLPFWMARGLYVEMRGRLDEALASPTVGDHERARGLASASVLAAMGGDFPGGHAFAARAVPLASEVGDEPTLARALVFRAWCGFYGGAADGDAVRADIDAALALIQRLDDPEAHAWALTYAGAVTQRCDTIAAGRAQLEQAIASMEASGVTHLLATACAFLSGMTVFAGDLDRARQETELLLRLAREHGQEAFAAIALLVSGLIAVVQDDEERAWAWLDEATTVARGRGLPTFDLMVRRIGALATLRFGTLHDARRATEQALEMALQAGSRWDEAAGRWLLGLVALAESDLPASRGHFERARTLSTDPPYPLWRGRALLGLARVAGADTDPEAAWELAHEALAAFADHGDRLGTVDALEEVAGLAADLNRPAHTVRLFAAAGRFRGDTGIVRPRAEREAFGHRLAAARRRLDTDELAARQDEGCAMSLEDAVGYARRGRGERGRPRIGWASLTPTERDVAGLVSRGCSNTEIGEQLLVSVNTVKTHLSRIYAKTGIEGRTELAAEAARRSERAGGVPHGGHPVG